MPLHFNGLEMRPNGGNLEDALFNIGIVRRGPHGELIFSGNNLSENDPENPLTTTRRRLLARAPFWIGKVIGYQLQDCSKRLQVL